MIGSEIHTLVINDLEGIEESDEHVDDNDEVC